MKIAVMMRAIDHDSGFQSYVIGLLNALLGFEDDHRYVLLYRTPRFLGQFTWSPKVKEILVTAPHKFLWDQVAVPWHAWREQVDIIFNPKFSVPFLAHCRVVMGLQEPAQWAWPKHYEKFDVLYEHLMLPLYCRRAGHLFPMAHWILEENRKYLRMPLRHATVTWPAPRPELKPVEDAEALREYRARRKLPERFLLAITRVDHHGLDRSTSFYPGKNPQIALRAFLQIRDQIPHHFIFLGRRVREFFQSMGFDESDMERVHCVGFLPFEELSALLSLADAMVHVPFYEGYGFSIMAALACGCPTVASKTGCCTEVVGDAALLADPCDPGDVAEKILTILNDSELRQNLRVRGIRRMNGITWEKAARLTLHGFEKAVAGHRGSLNGLDAERKDTGVSRNVNTSIKRHGIG
jgi:glycosyltransferase involved in cell wall biosynthesis